MDLDKTSGSRPEADPAPTAPLAPPPYPPHNPSGYPQNTGWPAEHRGPSYPGYPGPSAHAQPAASGHPGYPAAPAVPGSPGAYGGHAAQPYHPGMYLTGAPDHPQAMTAMILGAVGLAMGMASGIGLLMSPFAWSIGAKAVREIDASGGHLGGRSNANAGRIMGIVGTVLLIAGVVAVVGLISVIVTLGSS